MLGPFEATNRTDDNGNPTGGSVRGVGLQIDWQDGPLGQGPNRLEPNGAFVETVIAAVAERIRFFQASKFKCRENALAITKLEEALHWLDARTKRRVDSQIEGLHVEDGIPDEC